MLTQKHLFSGYLVPVMRGKREYLQYFDLKKIYYKKDKPDPLRKIGLLYIRPYKDRLCRRISRGLLRRSPKALLRRRSRTGLLRRISPTGLLWRGPP